MHGGDTSRSWVLSAAAVILVGSMLAGCDRLGSPEQRGQNLLGRGDYAGAVKAYGEAIAAGRDLPVAYAWRCYAYLAQGDDEAAARDCTEALELVPDTAAESAPARWEILNNRGVALLNLARRDEAEADFDAAIALKADYPDAYANRGRSFLDRENWERAIEDLTKAIELKADLAEAYGNRGLAYEGKGDDEMALADYDKAIEISHDTQAYFNRAMLQYTLGRFDLAYDDFAQVVEREKDPNRYLRFMAQQQLKLLENRPTAVPTAPPAEP